MVKTIYRKKEKKTQKSPTIIDRKKGQNYLQKGIREM